MRRSLNSSGYRLCWCSCLALVLLRVGIGWHFLYEGLWKIESRRGVDGVRPFSAEGYIAASSGPFRRWFRSHLDDPDALERLNAAGLNQRWERIVEQYDEQYGLSQDQKQSARAKIEELNRAAESYFSDPSISTRVNVYREEVERAEADRAREPDFVHEHAVERLKSLAKTREELIAPIDAWTKMLHEHVAGELTPEQVEQGSEERLGSIARTLNLPFKLEVPDDQIEQINVVTMLGLTVCGGLLLIGLFSRLAALGAAALVLAFYLCNPAPPLGTGLPGDLGHYLYVNKELVEFLAALVLATIPTGRWLGLDGLIHGLARMVFNRFSVSRPLLS